MPPGGLWRRHTSKTRTDRKMQWFLNWLLRRTPWSIRTRIKQVPGLARLQRGLVSAVSNKAPFEHEVDAGPAKGVRFLISLPDDKSLWTGAYEAKFAERIAMAVRPGAVALDIGGWHGFFAGVMAANGAGTVHVFEPLPANAERIAALVELNPKLNIRLHALALSELDGQSELLVMPDSSMAKLAASSFQADRTSEVRIPVVLKRLDTLVAEGLIDPPDLIKMDVEGAEASVLRGALETLRHSRPTIFAEIHSPALLEECRALLAEQGYEITVLDDDDGATRKPEGFQVVARPPQ